MGQLFYLHISLVQIFSVLTHGDRTGLLLQHSKLETKRFVLIQRSVDIADAIPCLWASFLDDISDSLRVGSGHTAQVTVIEVPNAFVAR